MRASWRSAYANFLTVVDVDAWGGRQHFAHGLAHQVIVVVVILARPLVGHRLVDARHVVGGVAHALVDDLAVLHHMAQAAVLLVVGIGVGFTGERRQQVAHVSAVKAYALNHIAHRVPILLHVSITVTNATINLNGFNHSEILLGKDGQNLIISKKVTQKQHFRVTMKKPIEKIAII